MGVGLLIISHSGIGEALLDAADHMMDEHPLNVRLLAADRDCDPDKLLATAKSFFIDLDEGDGVLVLTDLIGSTPSNIAHRLGEQANVNIITGINLSMLIRIYNYPDLNLANLTQKAYSGGIDGITLTKSEK